MSVREAKPLDALSALYLGGLYISEVAPYAALEYDSALSVGRMLEAIQDENYLFLLAFDSRGEAVGMLWAACAPLLPWSSDLIATDIIVYVRPEVRGTRHGFDLLKAYEDWAISKGAKEIRLSVASGIHEEKTGRLYSKMGYSHLGSQYRRKV